MTILSIFSYKSKRNVSKAELDSLFSSIVITCNTEPHWHVLNGFLGIILILNQNELRNVKSQAYLSATYEMLTAFQELLVMRDQKCLTSFEKAAHAWQKSCLDLGRRSIFLGDRWRDIGEDAELSNPNGGFVLLFFLISAGVLAAGITIWCLPLSLPLTSIMLMFMGSLFLLGTLKIRTNCASRTASIKEKLSEAKNLISTRINDVIGAFNQDLKSKKVPLLSQKNIMDVLGAPIDSTCAAIEQRKPGFLDQNTTSQDLQLETGIKGIHV